MSSVSTRTVLATAAALIGFAANSLLCRQALAPRQIDAWSFTAVRIVSGALMLAILARVARGRGPRVSELSGSWGSAVALYAYAAAFSLAYLRLGAGFLQLSASNQSDDNDLETYRIGAGFHLGIGSKLDAFGILSLAHVEIDGTADDFDDEGIAAELGLRALLSPKIEVNGSAEWVDVDDDNFGIGIGARYYFTDSLSVGGRVEKLDEDESFSAGVRFEF